MKINFYSSQNVSINNYRQNQVSLKTKPYPLDSVSFSSNSKENKKEFLKLREDFSKDLKKIRLNSINALWDFYTESSKENLDKLNKAQDKSNEFFDNAEIYSKLKSINEKGGIHNKKLKKQLNILTNEFGDGIEFKSEINAMDKKENEISQKFNSFVMKMDGKPISKTEITKILKTEKDAKTREKAFNAKVEAGNLIAEDLRELVKMRNDFAKKKGYDNFFDYKLQENYDITPEALDKLLFDVANKTKDANKKVLDKKKAVLSKELGIKPEELKNGDYEYLTGEAPERLVTEQINTKEDVVNIAKKAYEGMGYDIDNLPITLDLFPRKNKNTHCFSFEIAPGKEARILANLTNDISSTKALLHELGHSVFTVRTNPNIPYLEQNPTATMTEGVAMMMGDLPRTEGLLSDRVSPEINDKFAKSLGEADSSYIVSSMAIIDFERNMYKNPDQDLKQLWKDVNIKYRGRNENEEATNEWAIIPHFLSHPAYFQNYFRASLIKAQLYEALTNKFGKITKNKDTADYLDKNLFQYGRSKEDDELLIHITGKPLSADAFCNRINALVE